MIQFFNKGEIIRGSDVEIVVALFPQCNPIPADAITEFSCNFYTVEGASIEKHLEDFVIEGWQGAVHIEYPELEALADGSIRYVLEYTYMEDGEEKHIVKDMSSNYFLKTPTAYVPQHFVTEETVGEIVDEKIEEKGLISGDEADEKITEAAEAETARTEQTYSKIGTFSTFEKLNDYMYYTEYPYLDKAFADEYFRGKAPVVAGGCTSARYGNEYARNFDYYYSNLVEFVVKTKNTIGVAGGNPVLTKAFVEGNNYDDLYKIVPFYLQDGYCMKSGVFANINMVNREESKGTTTYSTPAIEEREQVCSIALVRYILDNFASAAEAVEYIKNYVSIFNPQAIVEGGYELHWMIGDSASTYVLETINGEVKYFEQDILSNSYVDGTTANTDGTFYSIADNPDHSPITENGLTPYASGIERYNYVRNNLGTVGLRELFNAIFYSNAYTKAEGEGFWYSEYVGGELGIGNTVAEYEADGRIERLKAEYEARTRENPTTWHTMHSCVYDFAKKTLEIVSQEDTGNTFEFKFEAGMSRDEVEEIVTSALTEYNPTDNFKTINGNSIIGQGNIVIQGGGGDSNYVIVDSLDDITEPYEGLKAYVKEQYADYEGVTITPSLPDNDHFAGRMFIEWDGDPHTLMYEIYYTGEPGTRDWHWGWDNSGKWAERDWNGHIMRYQVTDYVFNYFFIDDNEPYFEVEDSTTATTTFTVQTVDAKEYIYFEEYGWIERNMVLQEGQSYLQYEDYFFSDHRNPLDNGINIRYENKVIKIVSYRVVDDDHIYLMGYIQESDQKHIQYVFRYTHDGYLTYCWGDWAFVGDNFISSSQKGIKGGDFYHYTWDRTEEFTADGDNNRRMIGYLFPEQDGFSISSNQCWDRVATIYHGTESDYDWAWELRRSDNDYEGIENNGNWRGYDSPTLFGYRRNIENYNFELFFNNPEEFTIVLNDNPDINAAIEEVTLNAFPVWIYPFQGNNPRQVTMEIEGLWYEDYGDWKPVLMQYEREIYGKYFKCICQWHEEGWLDFYSSIPLDIDQEGDTRLWQQAQQGYFTLNANGYRHFNTIPDKLYRNYQDEGDVILFGEDEAEYLIEQETARTESTYVKQEDYQLINVSDLDDEETIVAVFANPERYRIIGREGNLYTYQYSKDNNTKKYFTCDYFGGTNGITMTAHRGYLYITEEGYAESMSDYDLPYALKTINGQDIKGEGNFSLVENVNGVAGIWQGTQAAYNAIEDPDPNTLYIIKG